MCFTNNHVLGSPEHCPGSVYKFGFLSSTTKTHRFHLDPDSFFMTSSEHIIPLDSPDRRKKTLEVDEKVQTKKNTNITIFAHPYGEPLAVSFGLLMTISEDGLVGDWNLVLLCYPQQLVR